MMRFTLNREKGGFDVDFDVPVTSEAAASREFWSLASLFEQKSDCSFERNDKQEITRICGSISSFLHVIDQSLPREEAEIQKTILNDLIQGVPGHSKTGLNINFHQNPFDTPQRYWNFILNQGHFVEYFFNRLNWQIAPQYEYVTDFPLHVDIEAASTCNMNCPMCYRDQMQETGQMDIDLFKRAVDECAANHVFSVRLSWRGETLTHPGIKDMIGYATRRIRNVSFLTNAFYLDEDTIECLIENGVSYVAVSFDGIGETYESIRHPATFRESYNRLALLQEKKKSSRTHLPQVRLCTVWPAIKDEPERYYRTMKEVSDYMVCNPYINFKGPKKIKEEFVCQYPWERIVIAFDGNTQCCTGWNADDIILGNTRERHIAEMWHSPLMKKIRDLHATGKRMALNSCAVCRHGSETDPDVDIRDIVERGY